MSAIYRRELHSYFTSPIGWLLVAFLLVMNSFYFTAYNLNGGYSNYGLVLISRSEKPRTHGGPYTLARNLGGVERHLAWDFEEFERHIDSLAKGLVGLGVQTGDRVGVVMGNNR